MASLEGKYTVTRSPCGLATLSAAAAFLTTAFCLNIDAAETTNGWVHSVDAYDRERISALEQAVGDDTYKNINGIVVIKNGQLLVERYFNGTERDDTHNPRSVSKTFTATILGIAIEQGYIESADQPLGDFYNLQDFSNFSTKKADVTLRQLITMSSGFDGYDFEQDSPGNEEFMYPQPNWVEWTLNLPMAQDRDPGDEWRYFTAGIVVLGDILNRAVPGGLESYAHEVLFGPLGISNYKWQHTPQRVANTAGGAQLTALGFAKFGELYRLRGRWNGKKIVPAAWAAESVQPRINTTVEGNRYGYLWWHKSYDVNGESWPTAYCTGNGGNKIFVFDDQELVVVITASAYGQRFMHSQVDEMMQRYILPAVSTQDSRRSDTPAR